MLLTSRKSRNCILDRRMLSAKAGPWPPGRQLGGWGQSKLRAGKPCVGHPAVSALLSCPLCWAALLGLSGLPWPLTSSAKLGHPSGGWVRTCFQKVPV